MKLTRRNFLIATSCLAVAKIPSISFASTGLDLPNDGYLFLIHDKVYWVPEVSVPNSLPPHFFERRPITQQSPLYLAHAVYDCRTRTWCKLRYEKFKVELFSGVRGKSSEQIRTELFMPRKVSHPVSFGWNKRVPNHGSV